jgi:hypothetical protein
MKFIIDEEQRRFFLDHQMIEFEEVLSANQVWKCDEIIDNILAQREESLNERLPGLSARYLKGRDLWRSEKELEKVECGRLISDIASQLTSIKPLVLAFDQILEADGEASTKQLPIFKTTQSIQAISSIQDLAILAVICLSPSKDEATKQEWLPKAEGSVVFMDPNNEVDLSKLNFTKGARYLLVAYGQKSSCYIYNEKDPHMHGLLDIQYSYGDRLSNDRHPLIYR